MVHEIIFATTNEAKVKQFQGALAPFGIVVKSLKNFTSLPSIEEDGETAQENAKKKATIYARASKQTVVSMDNALYFDKLPTEAQPGIHVRRIHSDNTRPTDEALLSHYTELVKQFGAQTTGRWEFAICIATPDGQCQETTIISPRIFTSTPSSKIVPGYPLESMQIDPKTGKYISEMDQAEQAVFWQRAIGQPLQDFIKKAWG